MGDSGGPMIRSIGAIDLNPELLGRNLFEGWVALRTQASHKMLFVDISLFPQHNSPPQRARSSVG